MAKVFLETGDDYRIVNNNTQIFGAINDDTDSVIIEAGTTGVIVNANVDRIDFAGNIADFRFEAGFGANMMVYSADGTTLLATIPLQTDLDGTQLVFADGAVASIFTAGTGITTGGVALTDTPAAIVPDAADIDDTVTTEADITPVVTTPTFSVSAPASVTEGGDATFTVTLSSAVAGATTVNYTLAGVGGAVLGTDTTTVADGSLTFAAGELTKTITVPVTLDAISPETGEGVTLTLSNPSTGTAVAATPSATTTITDVPVSYELTASAANVTEGVAITYTLTATAAAATDTSVAFSVVPGDATAPDQGTGNTNLNDFAQGVFNPATVVLLAGQKTATYTVTAAADTITELPENYSVKAEIGGVTVATKVTSLLDGVAGGVGANYTLTTNMDAPGATSPAINTLGTSGDDTYKGILDASTVTNATLGAIDDIDGAGGIDTLQIIANGAAATTITPLFLKNVEKISVNDVNVAAGTTVDLANATGVTDVINDGSVGAVAFQNIGSAAVTVKNVTTAIGTTFTRGTAPVTSALTVNMENLGKAPVISDASGTTGTQMLAFASLSANNAPTTATLNTTGFINVLSAELSGNGGAGHTLTTLTINAAGATNFGAAGGGVDILGFDTTASATINVTGAGSVAVNTLAAVVQTVNASANSGGVTLAGTVYNTGTNAAALAAPGLKLTGGSGKDSFTFDGVATAVVDLGANDDLAVVGGTLAAGASIKGGDGADTVQMAVANINALEVQSTDGAALRATISGFEKLGVTGALGANINASAAGGYNYVVLNGDVSDGGAGTFLNISGLTTGATVESRALGVQTDIAEVVMTGAALSTTDILNVVLNANLTAAVGTNSQATVKVGVAGINTVNVTANDRSNDITDDDLTLVTDAADNGAGDGYTLTLSNAANLNTLTVSGSSYVNYILAAGTDAVTLIDASASTGNFTTSVAAFAGTQRVEIKGSKGINDITGDDAIFGEKITGGAMSDLINGGDGADDLYGAGGRDSFAIADLDGNVGRSASTIDQIFDFGKITTAFAAGDNGVANNTVAKFQALQLGGAEVDILDFTVAPVLETAAAAATMTAGAGLLEAVDASGTEFSGKEINAAVSAKGLITLTGADKAMIDTLAEWVAIADTVTTVAGNVTVFEFGGSTYVYQTETAGAGGVDDTLIELVGVTGTTGLNVAGGGIAATVGDIFVI